MMNQAADIDRSTVIKAFRDVVSTKALECAELCDSLSKLREQQKAIQASLDESMKELDRLYETLDVLEKAEECKKLLPEPAPAETITEETPKRRRRRKKEEVEEMATPAVLMNEEQVKQHERYVRRKRKKETEEVEASKPSESTAEVNAKAREAGMTYGQYLAQREIKKLSEEMRQNREARHRKAAENDSERIPEQDPIN